MPFTPIFAAIGAAANLFPPLAAINSLSTTMQGFAAAISIIGAICMFTFMWFQHHDWGGIIGGLAKVVTIGALCMGVTLILNNLPGVNAALL